MSVNSDHLIIAIIAFTLLRRRLSKRELVRNAATLGVLLRVFGLGFLSIFFSLPLAFDFSYPRQEHLQIFEQELRSFGSLITRVTFVPLMEEALFREIILRNLLQWTGLWPALLVSSFLFGILHVYSIERILFAFLFGLLVGYIYYRYGFWAAVATHSGANLGGTLIPYVILLFAQT